MLFKSATLEGIRDGRITLAFRRWPKARVKAGSDIRSALGVVAIAAVDTVAMSAISETDARKAGYETRAGLLADLRRFGTGQVYRIDVRFAGNDPRASLRQQLPTRDDEAEISRRLARLDGASPEGPWTKTVLALSPIIPPSARPILRRSSAGKPELSKSGCASSRISGSPKVWRSAIVCRRAAPPI